MKKYMLLIVVTLTTILLIGADLATALEPIPNESGFSGFFRPGVGQFSSQKHLGASGGEGISQVERQQYDARGFGIWAVGQRVGTLFRQIVAQKACHHVGLVA